MQRSNRFIDLTGLETDRYTVLHIADDVITGKPIKWKVICKHCQRVSTLSGTTIRGNGKGCKLCQGTRGLSYRESLEIVETLRDITPKQAITTLGKSSSVIYTAIKHIKSLLENPNTDRDVIKEILTAIWREDTEYLNNFIYQSINSIQFTYQRGKFICNVHYDADRQFTLHYQRGSV